MPPPERLGRILARLRSVDAGDAGLSRLCEVCAEISLTSGAGIMLMAGHGPAGTICTSNTVSALIEDLQFTLGEGPGIDSYHLDQPVLASFLDGGASHRWPGFAPAALAAGVMAIFSFPLQVGAARLGALSLYCEVSGPLTDDQHADALALAGVVARAILVTQASAPPYMLVAELEVGSNFGIVVHQATGMVAVQLNLNLKDVLVRLRSYAFANEQPVADVAQEVVSRRLRFADEELPDRA